MYFSTTSEIMRNIILLSAFVFGLVSIGFTTHSTDQALQDGMPRMEFEKKQHDFGHIKQGEQVATVFYFVNTGNAPLVINDVVRSCGCTTPFWPKEPIAPGDTSKIDVKFNSRGKKGQFTKTITIKHNGEGGVTYLNITGFVDVPPPPGTPVEPDQGANKPVAQGDTH